MIISEPDETTSSTRGTRQRRGSVSSYRGRSQAARSTTREPGKGPFHTCRPGKPLLGLHQKNPRETKPDIPAGTELTRTSATRVTGRLNQVSAEQPYFPAWLRKAVSMTRLTPRARREETKGETQRSFPRTGADLTRALLEAAFPLLVRAGTALPLPANEHTLPPLKGTWGHSFSQQYSQPQLSLLRDRGLRSAPARCPVRRDGAAGRQTFPTSPRRRAGRRRAVPRRPRTYHGAAAAG